MAASAVGLILSLGTLLLHTFGVFAGPLTKEFGWSRTQTSGALAMSQYTFAPCVPAWGLLIDRFGPRPVAVFPAFGMSAVVASLSPLTPNLWRYYLAFAAASFLASAASPIGYSAVLPQVRAPPRAGADGDGHRRRVPAALGAVPGYVPGTAGRVRRWLLLGSGVVLGLSRNQAGDERAEQGFAASACVVHELEEAEVKRQLVLRDAAVRAEPRSQERPKANLITQLPQPFSGRYNDCAGWI